MNCDRTYNWQRGLGRRDRVGRRIGHSWFSPLAALSIALGVGLWGVPALAAPSSEGNLRTQTVDELFHSDSASGSFDRSMKGAIGYGARQIVGDTRLAEQLADDSNTSNFEAKTVATSAKKHHLPTMVIGLIAIGAILILGAVVLLIWSRIVHYREMHNAPPPMAFDYPRI